MLKLSSNTFACALLLFSLSTHSRTYEIMSYNVQNLLEVVHIQQDMSLRWPKGKKMPSQITPTAYRTDFLQRGWTEAHLKLKIEKIAEAILKGREYLPDFLGLNEVKGVSAVARLAKRLGYRQFQISSNDANKNGVNVALLYNPSSQLIFKSMRKHELQGPLFEASPTRSILEVHFGVGNKAKQNLTIFVNHWPSLAGPTEKRLAAAEILRTRVDEILAQDPEHLLIATGDFNSSPIERPYPPEILTTARQTSAGLVDVHQAFMDSDKVSGHAKQRLPKGTYFYPKDMAWLRFDCFFISRNLLNGKSAKAKLSSYKIHAPDFLTDVYEYTDPNARMFGTRITGVPKKHRRHDLNTATAGYSDHFPIIMRIKVD